MTGFDAVPDELRETAGRIGETVGGVADMVWRGPSGDYGHPGVQAGWDRFVAQLKGRVEALRGQADDLGGRLGEAANRYLENESETGLRLDGFDELVEGGGGPAGTGGGAGGLLGGALGAGPPAEGGLRGGIGSVLGGDSVARDGATGTDAGPVA